MTGEVDAALLWARERMMDEAAKLGDAASASEFQSGLHDDSELIVTLAEAHRAGHAHAAASAWQPIASAPDGLKVDVWFAPPGCIPGRIPNALRAGNRWYNGNNNLIWQPEYITHWMPIPAPPEVQHD